MSIRESFGECFNRAVACAKSTMCFWLFLLVCVTIIFFSGVTLSGGIEYRAPRTLFSQATANANSSRCGSWGELARHKRDTKSPFGHVVCVPGAVRVPTCVPWLLSWAYNNSLMFTVAPNTSSSIILPLKSLKGFRNGRPTTGDRWLGYWWYLTGHPVNTGWGTLVTTQMRGYWPSGSSDEAVFFAKRVTLMNRGTSLLLTLTLPDGHIRPPNATLFNTSCWGFQLWAWSSGTDPRFPIAICLNRTMSVAGRPVTNKYTLSAGAKITSTLLTDVDSYFVASTGISGHTNNWLLMAEQAAKMAGASCIACMGPRPLLKIIPANVGPKCAVVLMLDSSISPIHDCFRWDTVYPVAPMAKHKPLFSSVVAKGNFTCIRLPGTGVMLGALPAPWCGSVTKVTAPFLPIARCDIWFWCNSNKLYDRLPFDSAGICALVTLLLPVYLIPMSSYDLTSFAKSVVPKFWPRTKRDAEWRGTANPTYIDAIGVPRGVPDEYKLVNQIAAGFESALCWWCTLNKNVDRINYVHYNVQRLGNWTEAGFKAVHSQLAATSLMAFQNRMALGMLLSREGGVCAMFGEQCCTFIPNNTAADGSLSQALEGLRALNGKMKEHSGVNTEVWADWLNVFGRYRTLVSSALVSVAVFSAILTLCGCCCIPCLRSLINRLITAAISPPAETFPLLLRDDLSVDGGSFSIDDPVSESVVVNLSDLFSDPGFADCGSVSSRV
ncbi:uncharacterized protein LOC133167070 [Syngnathus typhle]|uniref:uncharacterized protein LOC133167070 n=1 Tax=Syngnathus typhle TaxID=161592 RepID=UPI002A69B9A6|nr:uncharacterized protein LOC133167070 [Syngnathus typhle]